MKVILEKDKCINCGSCTTVCSDFFEMDDNGLVILKGAKKNNENFALEIPASPADPPADEAGCIKEAAEACPVQAISIC